MLVVTSKPSSLSRTLAAWDCPIAFGVVLRWLSLLPKLCNHKLSSEILRLCANFCKLAHMAKCTAPTLELPCSIALNNAQIFSYHQWQVGNDSLVYTSWRIWPPPHIFPWYYFGQASIISQGLFHPSPTSSNRYTLLLQQVTQEDTLTTESVHHLPPRQYIHCTCTLWRSWEVWVQ